jgi:hypothetical protein
MLFGAIGLFHLRRNLSLKLRSRAGVLFPDDLNAPEFSQFSLSLRERLCTLAKTEEAET